MDHLTHSHLNFCSVLENVFKCRSGWNRALEKFVNYNLNGNGSLRRNRERGVAILHTNDDDRHAEMLVRSHHLHGVCECLCVYGGVKLWLDAVQRDLWFDDPYA